MSAADGPAVWQLLIAAFGRSDEAEIAVRLREDPTAWLPGLSQVAESENESVVGVAMLTRARIDTVPVLALAPVAVAPERQRRGIGSNVVNAALAAARDAGEAAVVVLGDPGYYRRFGFSSAADAGVSGPYEAAGDAFAVLSLIPGRAVPVGRVRYPEALSP